MKILSIIIVIAVLFSWLYIGLVYGWGLVIALLIISFGIGFKDNNEEKISNLENKVLELEDILENK